jgi:hypothetical protein
VSPRIVVALIVTFVSACGGEARRPAAAPSAPEIELESNTADDYVVGPIITASGTDREVRTYYIVRN